MKVKEINVPRLVYNAIKCKKCGDVIISRTVHDFVRCKCGTITNDGGLEYQHISYKTDTMEESVENLAVYSDAPFEEIRKVYCRGGRGKSGRELLTWVPLCEMNDEWVKAAIVYNEERDMENSFANKMYKKELKYRKDNKISVE